MMRAKLRRLVGDGRGATLVEFGFVAPVMVALLMLLGDLLYRTYVQSLLDGAIQKAGRDSAIQGGADRAADIDANVVAAVKQIAHNATWSSSRQNYNSFSMIKPEVIDDKNGNGILESKECFFDVNNNNSWDVNPSRSGQGGANDVTLYTVRITYPRLFPVTTFFGATPLQEVKASTLLKNQPYARQVRPVTKVCLP